MTTESKSAASLKLQRLADTLSQSPHLLAVRGGVVGALPLILVASMFLIIAQSPLTAGTEFVKNHLATLLLPVRMLTKVVGLYVSFGVGLTLAKNYKLDQLSGGLMSVACLLMSTPTMKLAPGPDGSATPGFGIHSELVGPTGIFPAIVFAFWAVEVQRLMVQKGFVIKLPPSVPEPIVQSFMALLPATVSISTVWLVVHWFGFDIHAIVREGARPLVAAGDSFIAMVSVVLVDSFFWLLGVHPSAILSVAKPIWFQMITENMSSVGHGPPPHIAPHETYLAFVWFGGSGGTLAVAILLWRAKSATLRAVAKVALVPAIFNINEPILFGVPIVLNRTLGIPFILAPLCSVTLTYFALSSGIVAPPVAEFPWTSPGPVGAWIATNGDMRAVLLFFVNLACSVLIYWPFLRRYDRELAAKEAVGADAAGK